MNTSMLISAIYNMADTFFMAKISVVSCHGSTLFLVGA